MAQHLILHGWENWEPSWTSIQQNWGLCSRTGVGILWWYWINLRPSFHSFCIFGQSNPLVHKIDSSVHCRKLLKPTPSTSQTRQFSMHFVLQPRVFCPIVGGEDFDHFEVRIPTSKPLGVIAKFNLRISWMFDEFLLETQTVSSYAYTWIYSYIWYFQIYTIYIQYIYA